jgi:hypothetical protein
MDDHKDIKQPTELPGIPALTWLELALAIAIIVVLAVVMWPEWQPARQ